MEQEYQIKILEREEIEKVYLGPAKRHFPANELKPLKAIWRMMEAGCYEVLGFYLGEEFVAYAFFVQTPDRRLRLLDYYAVLEEYRGKGIGGLFLKKISGWQRDCQGFFLETEDLALAKNEEERKERARRNAFYLRNGVVETPVKASYFSADYQIFYIPIGERKSVLKVCGEIMQIYQVMFLDKVNEIVRMTVEDNT